MSTSIPPRVAVVLAQAGLTALEFEPGSTPTSPLAAARIGCQVGQIAKSLVLRDKRGGFHLVVLAGDAKISSGKMKRLVGSETSLATADETLAVTGFRVGGVCPFGVEGIPLYVDASLRPWPVVYPAAGTDASGVPVTYARLVEVLGAQECDVASTPAPVSATVANSEVP